MVGFQWVWGWGKVGRSRLPGLGRNRAGGCGDLGDGMGGVAFSAEGWRAVWEGVTGFEVSRKLTLEGKMRYPSVYTHIADEESS